MKKLALVALLLTPFSAQADMEVCSALSALAETIMEARQDGMPMRDVLNMAEEHGLSVMVHQAYVQPSMSSEEGKLRQRSEFGNKWMLVCLGERK